MTKQQILNIGYFLIGSFALLTTFLWGKCINFEPDIAQILILFWILMPYLFMVIGLRRLLCPIRGFVLECAAIFFASGVGNLLLIWAIYIDPDPQSGFMFLWAPLAQLSVYGALRVTFRDLNKIFSKKKQ